MTGVVIAIATGSAVSAPISQDDSAAIPNAASPVAALVPLAEGDPRTDPTADASTSAGRRRRSAAQAAALDLVPHEAPASAATLPRRAPSAALVEEDPRVEIADVLESVARATATAVPWLRLGPARHDDVQRRPEVARAESDAELSRRIDNAAMARGEDPRNDGGAGAAGSLQVNLIQEAIQIARDFIASPLTWMFGVPIVLAGLMVAVLRGRGK